MAMTINHASSLTDSELLTEIPRLAHGEREATVALIAHLAEFDARRLFEGEGFPSTFRYCLDVLRLSEDAAFNRIEAADVQRAVSERDQDRCAFIARNGRRCGERRFLEFHHVVPYAAGGKPTIDNIQLRCRAHNRYEATLFYGPGREYGGVSETTRSGTGNHVIERRLPAGTPPTSSP